MKKSSSAITGLPRRFSGETRPDKAFVTGLQAFQIDALNACRGFQVAMAVNVFGVGTLLENDLPSR
jgi:hypothetical protein